MLKCLSAQVKVTFDMKQTNIIILRLFTLVVDLLPLFRKVFAFKF